MRPIVLRLSAYCLICFSVAQAAEPVAGTWKMTTTYRNRARNSIVILNVESERLTGIVLHHLGHRTPVRNVRVNGDKISFEVPSTRRGQSYTTRYQGTFRDDRIQGTTEYRRRGETRLVEWTAVRTTDAEITKHLDPPPVVADLDLTDQNYEIWRDHILPDRSEMAWEKIPWLSTFKDGILTANSEHKPLLLWTMNGHPLGCT